MFVFIILLLCTIQSKLASIITDMNEAKLKIQDWGKLKDKSENITQKIQNTQTDFFFGLVQDITPR